MSLPYNRKCTINKVIKTAYIRTGMKTQMITEYFTYSPKRQINLCDSLNPLSHHSENDFTFRNITAHTATNNSVVIGIPIRQSNIMHHDNGINK